MKISRKIKKIRQLEDQRRKTINLRGQGLKQIGKKPHCVLKYYVLLKRYKRTSLVIAEFVKIDKI